MEKVLFQPPRRPHPPLEKIEYLRNKHDKKIYFYHFDLGKPTTIIFSHGNAENLYGTKMFFETIFLPIINSSNVVVYEYTGYTQGNPDYTEETVPPKEEFLNSDLEAVYEHFVNEKGLDEKSIILWGQSLGSGPSTEIASKHPVGGLILQSAFLSIYRVIFNFRFTMPGDQFANIDKIPKVKAPIFLVHGVDDEIVPFYHSTDLYKACPAPKYPPLWVKGAGHNSVFDFGPEFFKRIHEFILYVESRCELNESY